MTILPAVLKAYLHRLTIEERRPAYFRVDGDRRVWSMGGDLERYGLRDLGPNEDVCLTAWFLEGILPLETGSIALPRLEVHPGVFADVHVFADRKGEWVLLLDSTADVAERDQIEQALRQAEEHLRQAERMESVGRLAGGIAHDFNNLLMIIMGYSELLKESMEERDPHRGPILEIRKAADRAATLTSQLLAFSRRQVMHRSIISLNDAINDAVGGLSRLIGEDVQFDLALDPRLAPVKADTAQMQQVIYNLAINARDAMPQGGRLKIETGNIPGDEREDSVRFVYLRVSDSGAGMDQETVDRIFEPFFTTKALGKGTGLGLATVYGIVRQCGGDISVRSQPGTGTQFEIRLPRASEKVGEPTARPEKVQHSPGNETILLVEDDQAVHQMVNGQLKRLGYKVLDAESTEEANRVSTGYEGDIHLLLTDVVMPDGSGLTLASRLRRERPGIRTLFMSGYSDEVIKQRQEADLDGILVQKPFTHERLAEAIREVLGSAELIRETVA